MGESYPSAEKQSVYSTVPADWTTISFVDVLGLRTEQWVTPEINSIAKKYIFITTKCIHPTSLSRERCDTSFMWSKAGLNSEFSFSYTGYQHYYNIPIVGRGGKRGVHSFPKGISI